MALKDQLEEKLGRLFSVPNDLITTIPQIQTDILTEIIGLLGQLERKGDLILLNEANIVRIEAISARLGDIIFGTEYTDALVQFASEFNVQGILNQEILNAISGGRFKNKDIFSAVLRKSQSDAISLLSQDAIQAQFVDPMKRILTDSVTNQVSFRDATKQVSEFITGVPSGPGKREGHLQRYVTQVTRDGFNIADRRYTQVISEDLDFEWFRYAGSTVKDSRVFCVDRVGKIFHKTEIEGWGSGANVGKAGFPWQGIFTGTNSSNIFAVLGGFNCMHALIAVSESVVPKDVRARIK